jgi:hypothetical protein
MGDARRCWRSSRSRSSRSPCDTEGDVELLLSELGELRLIVFTSESALARSTMHCSSAFVGTLSAAARVSDRTLLCRRPARAGWVGDAEARSDTPSDHVFQPLRPLVSADDPLPGDRHDAMAQLRAAGDGSWVVGCIDGVEWFRDATHLPRAVSHQAIQLDCFPVCAAAPASRGFGSIGCGLAAKDLPHGRESPEASQREN